MPPSLRAVPLPGDAGLRRLLADSLATLLPGCRVVAPELPFDGGPILALDAEERLLLVAFDREDGGRALLSGLKAVEALATQGRWMFRMFPGLPGDLDPENARLAVFAPRIPPGLERLSANVLAYTVRALQAGDEVGLLAEAWPPPAEGGADGTPVGSKAFVARCQPFRSGIAELNGDEARFFQGL